ncbi:MAG: rhomboid family intramembrane serine protease [candidate division WOR-3 bacterium]
MFFLWPIRTDSLVRRLPIITLSIIGLNALVFSISYPIEIKQEKIIIRLEEELREIEKKAFSPDNPTEIIKYAKDPKYLREKIRNREIELPEELWQKWKKKYDEFQEKMEGRVFKKYGFSPENFDFFTLFTSIFLHGSFTHLFVNIWFLWLVGLNVEDRWGRPFFLGFYLLSGVISDLVFMAITKVEGPLIGASGAIAGVMGAFAIQYYKSKIYFLFICFLPFIYRIIPLYAWFYLPLWFFTEILNAIYLTDYSNIAFWAHVGGFGFGALFAIILRLTGIEEKYLKPLVEDTLNLVDSKFGKAIEARSAGKIEEAENYLKEILKDNPSNIDAAKELIDIYVNRNKKEEASRIAKETFKKLRIGEKESSLILNFYEEILRKNKLLSVLSQFDFYFISQLYEKRENYIESAKVLASAYKINRKTDDAPYILLRLIRALALSGKEDILKKAILEMKNNFPEMKDKTIAILKEIKNGKRKSS